MRYIYILFACFFIMSSSSFSKEKGGGSEKSDPHWNELVRTISDSYGIHLTKELLVKLNEKTGQKLADLNNALTRTQQAYFDINFMFLSTLDPFLFYIDDFTKNKNINRREDIKKRKDFFLKLIFHLKFNNHERAMFDCAWNIKKNEKKFFPCEVNAKKRKLKRAAYFLAAKNFFTSLFDSFKGRNSERLELLKLKSQILGEFKSPSWDLRKVDTKFNNFLEFFSTYYEKFSFFKNFYKMLIVYFYNDIHSKQKKNKNRSLFYFLDSAYKRVCTRLKFSCRSLDVYRAIAVFLKKFSNKIKAYANDKIFVEVEKTEFKKDIMRLMYDFFDSQNKENYRNAFSNNLFPFLNVHMQNVQQLLNVQNGQQLVLNNIQKNIGSLYFFQEKSAIQHFSNNLYLYDKKIDSYYSIKNYRILSYKDRQLFEGSIFRIDRTKNTITRIEGSFDKMNKYRNKKLNTRFAYNPMRDFLINNKNAMTLRHKNNKLSVQGLFSPGGFGNISKSSYESSNKEAVKLFYINKEESSFIEVTQLGLSERIREHLYFYDKTLDAYSRVNLVTYGDTTFTDANVKNSILVNLKIPNGIFYKDMSKLNSFLTHEVVLDVIYDLFNGLTAKKDFNYFYNTLVYPSRTHSLRRILYKKAKRKMEYLSELKKLARSNADKLYNAYRSKNASSINQTVITMSDFLETVLKKKYCKKNIQTCVSVYIKFFANNIFFKTKKSSNWLFSLFYKQILSEKIAVSNKNKSTLSASKLIKSKIDEYLNTRFSRIRSTGRLNSKKMMDYILKSPFENTNINTNALIRKGMSDLFPKWYSMLNVLDQSVSRSLFANKRSLSYSSELEPVTKNLLKILELGARGDASLKTLQLNLKEIILSSEQFLKMIHPVFDVKNITNAHQNYFYNIFKRFFYQEWTSYMQRNVSLQLQRFITNQITAKIKKMAEDQGWLSKIGNALWDEVKLVGRLGYYGTKAIFTDISDELVDDYEKNGADSFFAQMGGLNGSNGYALFRITEGVVTAWLGLGLLKGLKGFYGGYAAGVASEGGRFAFIFNSTLRGFEFFMTRTPWVFLLKNAGFAFAASLTLESAKSLWFGESFNRSEMWESTLLFFLSQMVFSGGYSFLNKFSSPFFATALPTKFVMSITKNAWDCHARYSKLDQNGKRACFDAMANVVFLASFAMLNLKKTTIKTFFNPLLEKLKFLSKIRIVPWEQTKASFKKNIVGKLTSGEIEIFLEQIKPFLKFSGKSTKLVFWSTPKGVFKFVLYQTPKFVFIKFRDIWAATILRGKGLFLEFLKKSKKHFKNLGNSSKLSLEKLKIFLTYVKPLLEFTGKSTKLIFLSMPKGFVKIILYHTSKLVFIIIPSYGLKIVVNLLDFSFRILGDESWKEFFKNNIIKKISKKFSLPKKRAELLWKAFLKHIKKEKKLFKQRHNSLMESFKNYVMDRFSKDKEFSLGKEFSLTKKQAKWMWKELGEFREFLKEGVGSWKESFKKNIEKISKKFSLSKEFSLTKKQAKLLWGEFVELLKEGVRKLKDREWIKENYKAMMKHIREHPKFTVNLLGSVKPVFCKKMFWRKYEIKNCRRGQYLVAGNFLVHHVTGHLFSSLVVDEGGMKNLCMKKDLDEENKNVKEKKITLPSFWYSSSCMIGAYETARYLKRLWHIPNFSNK